MTMEEVEEASNYIKNEVNDDAEIFWGMVLDDCLEDEVQVTVIATGIDGHPKEKDRNFLRAVVRDAIETPSPDYDNVVRLRDVTPEDVQEGWTVKMNGVNLDEPTFMRQEEGLSDSLEEKFCKPEKKGFFEKFRIKESLDYPTFLRVKAD